MIRKAVVFEAPRQGYEIDQLNSPITVGQLRAILEDYDDDTLFILSHDNRYTYGSISEYGFSEFSEDEDGEWSEDDEW